MNHIKMYTNWKNTTLFKYIQHNYIQNYKIDHIAYRSFNKNIIINNLINNGYKVQNDNYNFNRHNASAVWLKNPNNIIPRVFISEYDNIYKDMNLIKSNLDIEKIDYYIKNENKLISYTLYNEIHDVNQYLAWTLVFRHHVENHLAINVENIDRLYKKISKDNIVEVSGNLQISEDTKLLQFSTKSENNFIKFTDGYFNIPTYFLEFVERLENRDGFSEKNADVIFDSTQHN